MRAGEGGNYVKLHGVSTKVRIPYTLAGAAGSLPGWICRQIPVMDRPNDPLAELTGPAGSWPLPAVRPPPECFLIDFIITQGGL